MSRTRSRALGAILVAALTASCATVAPRRCQINAPSEGRVALDSPDPKYRDYVAKVREQIRTNWVYPRSAGEQGVEGDLLIDFDVAKDGRLTYIVVARSSGARILDDYALTAVKLTQPFPPVPDSVSPGDLRLSGTFCYQLVKRFLNQTLR
jgi:TonB family protein